MKNKAGYKQTERLLEHFTESEIIKMLRTVYIKYREPLTQIWVEGKEEMYFRSEEEMQSDFDDWCTYFSRLYGNDFEMTICD